MMSDNADGFIDRHSLGGTIMVEREKCECVDATWVCALTKRGYEGIYICLENEVGDLVARMKRKGAIVDKVLFVIEGNGRAGQDGRFIRLSAQADVDDVVRSICVALAGMKSRKRFICIGSLGGIASDKALSELLRLFKFLGRIAGNHENQDLLVILCARKNDQQARFIRDIAMKIDEVVTA